VVKWLWEQQILGYLEAAHYEARPFSERKAGTKPSFLHLTAYLPPLLLKVIVLEYSS
jgi:hypothetical protein